MAKVTKKKAPADPTEPLQLRTAPVTAEAPRQPKKRSGKFKKSYIVIAAIVLIAGVGGVIGYREYDKVKKENARLSNPEESARAETEKTKQEVGSLMELPTDEEPTIATVKDSSQLEKQSFYAKAQNGDRVIFYAKAKKAILYRPSTKKIVEVATLNIGDKPSSQTAPSTDVPRPEATGEPAISNEP